MDIRNFFKKFFFVENQHAVESKKCEYVVEPYAEIDTEQLSESSNNKKEQQYSFTRNLQKNNQKNNFQKNKRKL